MKTWGAIQAFIAKHSLPYKVIRWNMSLRGCLVDTFTHETVAYSVKDAAKWLKG